MSRPRGSERQQGGIPSGADPTANTPGPDEELEDPLADIPNFEPEVSSDEAENDLDLPADYVQDLKTFSESSEEEVEDEEGADEEDESVDAPSDPPAPTTPVQPKPMTRTVHLPFDALLGGRVILAGTHELAPKDAQKLFQLIERHRISQAERQAEAEQNARNHQRVMAAAQHIRPQDKGSLIRLPREN